MATPLPAGTPQLYSQPATVGYEAQHTGQPWGYQPPTVNYGGYNVGPYAPPGSYLPGRETRAPAFPPQHGGQPPFTSVARYPALPYMTPQHPPGAPTAHPPAAAGTTTPASGETKADGEKKAVDGEKKATDGEKKTTDGEKQATDGKDGKAGKSDGWLGGWSWGGFLSNQRHAGQESESKSSGKADEKAETAEKKETDKAAGKKEPEKAPDQGAKPSTTPTTPPAPGTYYGHQPQQPVYGHQPQQPVYGHQPQQPLAGSSPHVGYQHLYRSAMQPHTPASGAHTPPAPGHEHPPASGAQPHAATPGAPQDTRSAPPDGKEPSPMQYRSGFEQRVQSEIQDMSSRLDGGAPRSEQRGYTTSLDSMVRKDLSQHREHSRACEEYLDTSTNPETQRLRAEERANERSKIVEQIRAEEQAKAAQQYEQRHEQRPMMPQNLQGQDLRQDLYWLTKQAAIDGMREGLGAQMDGMDKRFGPFGQKGITA